MPLDDDDRARIGEALRMLREIVALDAATFESGTLDGDPYPGMFGRAQGLAIAAVSELVPVLRYELREDLVDA